MQFISDASNPSDVYAAPVDLGKPELLDPVPHLVAIDAKELRGLALVPPGPFERGSAALAPVLRGSRPRPGAEMVPWPHWPHYR